MSSKVDLQLIIAFVDGELSSSEREEVSTMIKSDEQWFSAYVDIKSTKEELKNVKLEVTPDELKVYKDKKISNFTFNFDWILKPQIASGAISVCLLFLIFSVYSNDSLDYSTRSIETEQLVNSNSYLISENENDYKEFENVENIDDLNKLLIPSLEIIESQPTNPSGYLIYTNLILGYFSKFFSELDDNDALKLISSHNEILDKGVNILFKNISIKQIQLNPRRYFNEIMVLKYLAMTNYDLKNYECISLESEIEKYQECIFNSRLNYLVQRDIVNNIFLVNSDLNALDYFNQDLSEISNELINNIINADGKNIIIYEIDSSSYINDPTIYIYLLKRELTSLGSLEEQVSIYEYNSTLDGAFWSNIKGYILNEDNKIKEFFGEPLNVNSLEEKVNIFIDLLSNPKSKQKSSLSFKISNYDIEISNNRMQSIEKFSETFHSLLFKGLLLEHPDLIENADLLIIPDPLLSNIPFSMLYDGNDRDKKTLDNMFNISYGNSLIEFDKDIKTFQEKYDSKYLNLIEEFHSKNSNYSDTNLDSLFNSEKIGDFLIEFYETIEPNVVGFGNSDYENFSTSILKSKGIKSISNLNWSSKELNIFNQKNIFYNSNATETNFLNYDLSNTDILHLSLHGFSNYVDPFESSMIFQSDSFNDGFLTINEIRNKDLSNVELVFLSACDTNQGKVFKNFNLLSVQKAFKDAGALNVISTMWEVNDKATAKFVEVFYEILMAEDNINYIGYVLAESKLEFIERYPEYSHPHFWAGFAVYGY